MSDDIEKDLHKTLGKLGFYAKFEDLEFKPHGNGRGIHARMEFGNNYGVSVVQGSTFYTNGDDEYQLAVMHEGNLTYSTHITDDVLGHLSEEEVTDTMRQVQELVKEKE